RRSESFAGWSPRRDSRRWPRPARECPRMVEDHTRRSANMKLTFRFGVAAVSVVLSLAPPVPAAHAAAPTTPGYWVCVTNEQSGDLSIVDGVTRRPVATIPLGKRPRGIHASPDGRTLYVALSGTPFAGPPGERHATTVAAFPDGRATDRYADGIAVLDLARRQVVRVIPAGTDPEELALDRAGPHLFVSNEDSGTGSEVRRY